MPQTLIPMDYTASQTLRAPAFYHRATYTSIPDTFLRTYHVPQHQTGLPMAQDDSDTCPDDSARLPH